MLSKFVKLLIRNEDIADSANIKLSKIDKSDDLVMDEGASIIVHNNSNLSYLKLLPDISGMIIDTNNQPITLNNIPNVLCNGIYLNGISAITFTPNLIQNVILGPESLYLPIDHGQFALGTAEIYPTTTTTNMIGYIPLLLPDKWNIINITLRWYIDTANSSIIYYLQRRDIINSDSWINISTNSPSSTGSYITDTFSISSNNSIDNSKYEYRLKIVLNAYSINTDAKLRTVIIENKRATLSF